MRGKMAFLTGAAVGYVLGSRAGRERYEQISAAARKIKDSPTLQEAAGVMQAQAARFAVTGKDAVAHRLSHTKIAHTRLGERLLGEHDGYAMHESHRPNGGTGHGSTHM